jgi:hypothetical protein
VNVWRARITNQTKRKTPAASGIAPGPERHWDFVAMSTLSKWDATRNGEALASPSTGITREWWRDQSRADCTDWISLIDAADTALQGLRAVPSLGHVMPAPWKKLAAEAWDAASWREAACEYHDARSGRVLVADIDSRRSQLLRRLMGDDTSVNRAWDEINSAARERFDEAAKTTYDTVDFELSTYGLSELSKGSCQRRLADLSIGQLKKLMVGLQQRRGQYPAVSDELLAALAAVYDARVSNEG